MTNLSSKFAQGKALFESLIDESQTEETDEERFPMRMLALCGHEDCKGNSRNLVHASKLVFWPVEGEVLPLCEAHLVVPHAIIQIGDIHPTRVTSASYMLSHPKSRFTLAQFRALVLHIDATDGDVELLATSSANASAVDQINQAIEKRLNYFSHTITDGRSIHEDQAVATASAIAAALSVPDVGVSVTRAGSALTIAAQPPKVLHGAKGSYPVHPAVGRELKKIKGQ